MVISPRKGPINITLGVVLLRDWSQSLIISFLATIFWQMWDFTPEELGYFKHLGGATRLFGRMV